jgi:hypothetical protein
MCIIKQVDFERHGISCLIKELQIQWVIRQKKKLAILNQQNLFVHGSKPSLNETGFGKYWCQVYVNRSATKLCSRES